MDYAGNKYLIFLPKKSGTYSPHNPDLQNDDLRTSPYTNRGLEKVSHIL
jgi:hypothetical protein